MFAVCLCLAWLAVLSVSLFTDNLSALLFHHAVQFRFSANPDWAGLLSLRDAHVEDLYWWFVKSGHFMGFAVLDLFILQIAKDRRKAAAISLFCAAASEIVQLFFMRDGRLLDIGIDAAGILFALFLSRESGRISGSSRPSG
jgi:hypothetical protein